MVALTPHRNRRRHPRQRRLEWADSVQARIRPGHDVIVIDLSHGGALVETSRRLTPGATAELQLEALHGRHTTRAAVVRSYVCLLQADQVLFRTALAFERPVPWLREEAPAAAEDGAVSGSPVGHGAAQGLVHHDQDAARQQVIVL